MVRAIKLSIIAAIAFGVSASDAIAGKPPKPVPTQPVKYQVQYWAAPGYVLDVNDTNSHLQSVGWFDGAAAPPTDFRAYLYDPSNQAQAVDLNLIVSGLRPGWQIRNATAINETGLIGAYTTPVAAPLSELQAVIIDLNRNPPTVTEIPDRSFTDYSAWPDINDLGEIVAAYRRSDGLFGHYVCTYDAEFGKISIPQPLVGVVAADSRGPRINNSGDIVGMLGTSDAYRLSWDGAFEEFANLLSYEINEGGVFCGRAIVFSGKGKNANSFYYAFLCGSSPQQFTENNTAVDLNESNDFLSADAYARINHRQHGSLTIADLLDPADGALIEYKSQLYCGTMTERMPGTGFPILTGRYRGVGVQLFPVAP